MSNDKRIFTVGSLFSGIGGIELGLERTGRFRTVWNSEIEPYACAVLRKHWPEVPNLGDITKVDWRGGAIEKPDVICGGFPCQDISRAGKGAGIKEGTRSGLWFEFKKAISFLHPRVAFVENVSAITFRGLLAVLGDLADIGYDAEWVTVRASDVGAPHQRERLFIVAYPYDNGRNRGKVLERRLHSNFKWDMEAIVKEGLQRQFAALKNHSAFYDYALPESGPWSVIPPFLRVDDGVPGRVDRIKCLGNAVVPQVAQEIGEMICEKIAL